MRYIQLSLALLLYSITNLQAQNTKPSIFLDCQTYCQKSYIIEQITFVNYMQNRQEADVYILATRQNTGAGGGEVQLVFEGNNKFSDMRDTIKYTIDPNATDAITRDQMVQGIKQGLFKYIINTDLINSLEYSILTEDTASENIEEIDPWNYWVFNVGGNGWLNGEQSYSRTDLSTNISANRITDKNKFEFSARYNYTENKFTLSDGEEFKSILKSHNFYLEYVKSISQHWSIGGVARTGASTFGNTDINSSLKAAIEYNLFPYSDAQTRRFSFFYTVEPEFFDYTELTIYDKLQEIVGRHGLTIEYQQTQKWGNISFSLGVQQYFHNLKLYNAYMNPYVEWQIFKGLSFSFGGFFSFVNDRLNIAKTDITDEEILLQIKQLDTDFSFYSHFGINYRFGSSYNNFVNPRF